MGNLQKKIVSFKKTIAIEREKMVKLLESYGLVDMEQPSKEVITLLGLSKEDLISPGNIVLAEFDKQCSIVLDKLQKAKSPGNPVRG